MDISQTKHIPSQPWVYFFKNKSGQILYIGKAKDLKKRIIQYFSPGSLWKQDMISQAHSVDFLIVKNESEALYLEDNLIKENKPEYNNLLKWDNWYAYIKITNEQFPQIFLTRNKIPDGSTYIGPKHNLVQLKKFIQYLRQILKFRWCKKTQFRQGKICSDYYFGICAWRCDKKIMNYELWIMNYGRIIDLITSFFKWNIGPIQKEIKNQISNSIHSQNFERAAKLRDIYVHIQDFVEQQTVVIDSRLTWYFFQIKQVSGRNIYCLLYFWQWKLVDIISSKENDNDLDFQSLIINFNNEFWEFTTEKIWSEILWHNFILNRQKNQWNVISLDDWVMPTTCPSSLRMKETISINEVKWLQTPKSRGQVSKAVRYNSKKIWKKILFSIKQLSDNFLDSYIISQSLQDWNIIINDILKNLQTRYYFKKFPYRIECVDISHLSWWRTSWGLSCLLGWLKNSKWYRRYKISFKLQASSFKQWDDYMALEELLKRRIKSWWEMPNLFILDGWKWQLGIIKKLYHQDSDFKKLFNLIDFVSLWKWKARGHSNQNISEKLYYFDDKLNIHSKDLIYDQVDKILTQARDEAHRFANAYRKKQMSLEMKN